MDRWIERLTGSLLRTFLVGGSLSGGKNLHYMAAGLMEVERLEKVAVRVSWNGMD